MSQQRHLLFSTNGGLSFFCLPGSRFFLARSTIRERRAFHRPASQKHASKAATRHRSSFVCIFPREATEKDSLWCRRLSRRSPSSTHPFASAVRYLYQGRHLQRSARHSGENFRLLRPHL